MQQQTPKQTGLDNVLKQAFFYWKSTLSFQLLFSLITFSILIGVGLYFSARIGLLDAYAKILNNPSGNIEKDLEAIMLSPDYQNFSLIILGVKAFLYPLEMGLFQMYRKIDMKQSPELSDMLVGYRGTNFFIFMGYYCFWYLVLSYSIFTIVLPVLWVLCTLFVAPMMFFTNQPMFRAIGINLKVLRTFIFPMLVCSLVAFVFRYSGFLLFGFGVLLTYPFSTAMIYALYQTIFREKR